MNKTLTIATRQSPMALYQANFIKHQLQIHYPQLTINIAGFTTQGDQNTQVSLKDIGGKDLFVKELQKAILNKEADIAVHCIKDMSVYPYPNLCLAAVYQREDPRDAFVSPHYAKLSDLPQGAIVGTASPRRECILKSLRPDLHIKLLRGNVNTRLKKLNDGEYDAILLAAAGLQRLQFMEQIREYFDLDIFIPAIGQGALGIECRADDKETLQLIRVLNHIPTEICIAAERAVNQKLGGDCHTAIGAYATLKNDQLQLHALIGNTEGKLLRSSKTGSKNNPTELGFLVAEDLLAQGASDFLRITSH